MKKKWLKRGGAVLTAFALVFSSLTAYAAEPDTGQTQADGQYDTAKPVIEKVEFPQNGQTLNEGDRVELYVYAYDADSGISAAYAEVALGKDDKYTTFVMNQTYDEEKGCYVLWYDLNGVSGLEGYIRSIRVTDTAGNYCEWPEYDPETYQHLYTFDVTDSDLPEYHATDFQLDVNGQTLQVGDEYNISLAVEPAYSGGGSVIVNFSNGVNNSFGCYLSYNEETGNYSGGSIIDNFLAGDKWVLQSVEIQSSGLDIPILMDGMENYWFEVEALSDQENPKIASIELEKNGEILRPGEQAVLRIKAEDNEAVNTDPYSWPQAAMTAAADIASPIQYIPLTYNEETDAFEGVFEVTEDTYPCEWYLSWVNIYDMSGNRTEVEEFDPHFNQTLPYYINVANGETFTAQTYDISLSFMKIGENGYWTEQSRVEKTDVPRRSTFSQAGIEFPEEDCAYPGLTLKGWADGEGREINGDSQILGSWGYGRIYPVYDKIPVKVNYTYLGPDGSIMGGEMEDLILFESGTTYREAQEYVNEVLDVPEMYEGITFQGWEYTVTYNLDEELPVGESVSLRAKYDKGIFSPSYGYLNDKDEWRYFSADPILFEKGTTYGEIFEEAEKFRPDDASDRIAIQGWQNLYYTGDPDVEIPDYAYQTFIADYGNKVVVIGGRSYYDGEGYRVTAQTPYVVDKGTKASEICEELEALENPEMYPGLKFESWQSYAWQPDETINESGTYVTMEAVYSNCVVRMVAVPQYGTDSPDEGDYAKLAYITLAEQGDTVTLPDPSELEGFEDVEWIGYPENGELTVYESTTIYGYTDGEITDPDDPDNPPQPGEEGKPLPDDAVDSIINMIQNADPGDAVPVEMGDATVISKEILEAAKGKDVEIQLDMGDYTWTIQGQDIQTAYPEDINLSVNVDADAIPSDVIQELAGDNPTRQLSLAHEGDFGFQAELTLNVGGEYAGKYGNLFYYDSDGKLVFINAGTITPEGNVSLTFSHASDYVIVFSDEEMSDPTEPDPGASEFTDVHENDWYYDPVQYVSKNKLMTGLDETTFGPIDPLARAQFAVILHRMNGEPEVPYSARFHDVGAGLWYTNAILWAADTQVVTGYSNGNFGPGDLINREQMALMMFRYANYKGYDTSARADFSSYQDSSMVSDFAAEAMQWAVGEKIITGKYNETQLDPKGNASRAECATIIMRFVEKYGK